MPLKSKTIAELVTATRPELEASPTATRPTAAPHPRQIVPLRPDPDNLSPAGDTILIAHGVALTPGQPVCINSDGHAILADANDTDTYPCIGLAMDAGGVAFVGRILLRGVWRDDTYAWTPGGRVWLSLTAGSLTQTEPSGSGEVVQVVGMALTADLLYVNPVLDYDVVP